MNIQGINKAEILSALFNASRQQGMGFLDKRGSQLMTVEDAQTIIDDGHLYFDYLYGRVMKISLKGGELETRLYDRDNGLGAAEAAISHLLKVQESRP